MKKLKFWVDRPGYSRNFALFVGFEGEKSLGISKPLEFETIADEGGYLDHKPPALELSPTDAQALMDELYRAGIRPTRMEDSAGALQATKQHLKDMQAIAFSLVAGEVELARQFKERGISLVEDHKL